MVSIGGHVPEGRWRPFSRTGRINKLLVEERFVDQITLVDDDEISIRHRLWTDALRREHLERAAEVIEEGRITRHAGLFAEGLPGPLFASRR